MHLFWLGLILLVWVLLFPAEGYKTDRWIDLGFISFQPSEVIRLLLPLAAASYLTRNQKRNHNKRLGCCTGSNFKQQLSYF